MPSCFEVGRRSYEEELEEDQCGWSPESKRERSARPGEGWAGSRRCRTRWAAWVMEAFLPTESGQLQS